MKGVYRDGGSNPDYPQMRQLYSTLADWKQIEQYLLQHRQKVVQHFPSKDAVDDVSSKEEGKTEEKDDEGEKNEEELDGRRRRFFDPADKNRFFEGKERKVIEPNERKLKLPFLSDLDDEAVTNTLKYMFFHLR